VAALARPRGQSFDNAAPIQATRAQSHERVIEHIGRFADHAFVAFRLQRLTQLARFFRPGVIRDAVERRLGVAYVEGWVHERDADGRDLRVRAFGARTTHVVAGNSPGVSAQTIVRNAVTRSDAIIKTPDGSGKSVNALEVRVAGDTVSYVVNGTVVHTTPKSAVKSDGIAGFRVNHVTEVMVDNFEVQKG